MKPPTKDSASSPTKLFVNSARVNVMGVMRDMGGIIFIGESALAMIEWALDQEDAPWTPLQIIVAMF